MMRYFLSLVALVALSPLAPAQAPPAKPLTAAPPAALCPTCPAPAAVPGQSRYYLPAAPAMTTQTRATVRQRVIFRGRLRGGC